MAHRMAKMEGIASEAIASLLFALPVLAVCNVS